MNKKKKKTHFIDVIPQLETQLGISSLEYLSVAISQAEHYKINDLANWFKAIQDRLAQCIEREWSEEEFPLHWDTEDEPQGYFIEDLWIEGTGDGGTWKAMDNDFFA